MQKRVKRGLSAVITTLIMVLFVLVAIGIVWVVVKNVVTKGTEEVGLGKIIVDIDIKKVVFNGNNISITLKRNVGEGEITNLRFVVKNSTNSEIFEEESSIKELEEKNFILSPLMNVSSIIQISVAPIFKTSSGKEVVGSVSGTYNIKGTEVSGGECTPLTYYKDADSDNYGNLTNITSACPPAPPGYVSDSSDCNDNDSSKWQLLNGYVDNDNDNYGYGSAQSICSGSGLPLGYSNNNLDCNDTNSALNPGVSEICNFIDDDCDGSIDDGGVCVTFLKTWNGLVSWWKFDGNVNDSKGINHGTQQGGVNCNAQGKYGNACLFDGVNDYVNTNADNAFDILGNLSVSAWVNFQNKSGNKFVLSKWGGDVSPWDILFDFSNNLTYRHSDFWDDGLETFTFSDKAILNQWRHIVLVRDDTNSRVTFYINGIQSPDGWKVYDKEKMTVSTRTVKIGSNGDGNGGYFNGSIDEVIIFNRSLTASEIQQIYAMNLSM